MQLAAGVVRVVHARDAEAELEPQVLVVPQHLRHLDEVLARDVQRELLAVDDDGLDGVREAWCRTRRAPR